jgi:hypothetical protein
MLHDRRRGLIIGGPIDQTYAGLYGLCLLVALLMTFIKTMPGWQPIRL